MPTSVRVATWNCFGAIASLQGLLLARPRWPERLVSPHLARELGRYDVVCVQENFLPFVTTALEEVAHELGMHLWHDRDEPAVAGRAVFGSGLAVLSRKPPRRVRFSVFEGPSHGFDAYAAKGFLVAEFDALGPAPFRVVNTHLQADDPLFPGGQCPRVRAAQLEVLLDAVSPEVPTLVVGDLNVAHGSDEHARVLAPALARRGLADLAAPWHLPTYEPSTNDLLRAMSPTEPASRLDYLLASDTPSLRWRTRGAVSLVLAGPLDEPLEQGRGRLFASDHYGLGAALTLEPIEDTPAALHHSTVPAPPTLKALPAVTER